MTTVTTKEKVDDKFKKQETIPKFRPEVMNAMEEAKKLSKDPNVKRYSNFSAALEELD